MNDVVSWSSTLVVGLEVTLQLAFITGVLAILLSTLLAIMSISPSRLVRVVSGIYTDIFRSIPILALLLFLYYGLGPVVGQLGISGFWLAVAGLTLIESAYLGEVYRGALQSVGGAQWHAASSLGLSWPSTLALVILPQAVPAGIPGTVNIVIGIIKDSSLASLIAVPEVTQAASLLVSVTFRPLPIYTLLAGFYIAIILPLTAVAYGLEKFVARRLGLHVSTAQRAR
jgi:His/Glu/Gln/Arg/opine family amino acid ABC transporter permease subunit